MSDKNWQAELTAYIDGELPEASRRELEAALATDPALKALEQRLRQTVALMAKVPLASPSPDLKRSVLERLDEPPPPGALFGGWSRWVPVFAVAAAALVVVLVRGVGRDEVPAIVEEDQVVLAQNMELVEDLDLVGLASAEDLEVVEQLEALEVTP